MSSDSIVISRPGISAEMLVRAGVRRVSAQEAGILCNLTESGLWLPYLKIDGTAVTDGGKPYGRLRLDAPQGSKKYHQTFGTSVHAYLPPGLNEAPPDGDLYVIEGEFKSLALTEAGCVAVGISGFFGFAEKGGEKLVSELAAVVQRLRPKRVLFCGDSDTALNYQFAVAAVRIARMLTNVAVLLPRVPVNGPGKGVDDCRQVLNGSFVNWWQARVSDAVTVNSDTDSALLAIDLFEREQGALASLRGLARYDNERRIIKLAAALESQPLLQERVLQFAEKKLGIARRGLSKAVKAAAQAAKRTSVPEDLECYYESYRKNYWIPDTHGEMVEVTETSLARHLRQAGFSDEADGAAVSPIEMQLARTQTENNVVYAGPLAGHSVGLKQMCGQRVLVTQPVRLIEPKAGDCPMIEGLFTALFNDPAHNQTDYVMGWLKVAYEALAAGQLRHGQALAIAGPRNCGKSLFQNLITEILGGRSAKPYRYMCGGTDFNADLFAAEHLMIEDEAAFTDIRTRRHFGARIKDFTVNTVQSCHGKNRQAVSLTPFWRLTITLNDEPENLLILPPLDESLEDKITLLKALKNPLPMSTQTLEEYRKFKQALLAEIPAFLSHLSKFRIPDELKCDRFGITHFHHPELLASLSDMSPEMRLLALIDTLIAESDDPGQWTGSATELEKMLLESSSGHEARRLLDWNNATGTYLGRLAKKLPNRIKQRRTANSRMWVINPVNWSTVDPESAD